MEKLRCRNWYIQDSGYYLGREEKEKNVELELSVSLMPDLLIKRKIKANK